MTDPLYAVVVGAGAVILGTIFRAIYIHLFEREPDIGSEDRSSRPGGEG